MATGRSRKPKRNRDGVVIQDNWQVKGRREGKRWSYRIWDSTVRRYHSRAFAEAPADEGRRTPGCAAGDAWAKVKRARFNLGEDGAAEAPTAELAVDYVQSLRDQHRHEHHVREVERVLADLVKAGATDLKARDFPGKVEHWRRNLKAIERNEPKAGQTIGRVRRVDVFDLSPVTVNRYMVHVRALVSYALKLGLLHRNPLAHLKSLREPDTVKATFSIGELRTLVEQRAYDDPAWMWAVLMAFTGCRAQEAMHLRWEAIDRDAGHLTVRLLADYDLKGDKERTIPLQAGLADILANHPQRRDIGWIVPETFRKQGNKAQAAALRRRLEAAGIDLGDRTPHSFRHSFAAMLVATNQSAFAIVEAMGHSDLKITQRYAREQKRYRTTIEAEGWKPGELRLVTAKAVAAS